MRMEENPRVNPTVMMNRSIIPLKVDRFKKRNFLLPVGLVPICLLEIAISSKWKYDFKYLNQVKLTITSPAINIDVKSKRLRSEERRVGKEYRSGCVLDR